MAPIGLRFEWRDLARAGGHEVSPELAVVSFKGRCDTAGLVLHSKFEGAWVGRTSATGRFYRSPTSVVTGFETSHRPDCSSYSAEDRPEKYGRALGRVLAHELYHIFAKTMRHGSSGVSKESYSVQDLLSDDLQFQAKESQMLQVSRPRPAVVMDAAAGSVWETLLPR